MKLQEIQAHSVLSLYFCSSLTLVQLES